MLTVGFAAPDREVLDGTTAVDDPPLRDGVIVTVPLRLPPDATEGFVRCGVTVVEPRDTVLPEGAAELGGAVRLGWTVPPPEPDRLGVLMGERTFGLLWPTGVLVTPGDDRDGATVVRPDEDGGADRTADDRERELSDDANVRDGSVTVRPEETEGEGESVRLCEGAVNVRPDDEGEPDDTAGGEYDR